MADKVIRFKSGNVEEIIMNKHPKSVDEIEWLIQALIQFRYHIHYVHLNSDLMFSSYLD